ncbi:formylglycine-generating enzyme family protein, partial [Serratia sp. NPDC078593]
MMKQGYVLLLAPLLLVGCDNPPQETAVMQPLPQDNAELQSLIRQVKSNLVFVQGGDFLMGDFGGEYGSERIQLDTEKDSKPLHNVTLSSYSIGKFKTTNQE